MSDLVKMLYDHALGPSGEGDDLHCMAAAEIERLQADIAVKAKLLGALIDIKRLSEKGWPTDAVCIRTIERVILQLETARNAFAQTDEIHSGETK